MSNIGRKHFYNEFIKRTGVKISYSYYNLIIKQINEEIANQLLEGNKVKLPYSLGFFEILKQDRKKPAIHWGNSNKNKKEILSRGGTLYEVLEKDENDNIIKDNGGEKWLSFITSPYYFRFNWYKTTATRYIPNIGKFEASTIFCFRKRIAKIEENNSQVKVALKFNLNK